MEFTKEELMVYFYLAPTLKLYNFSVEKNYIDVKLYINRFQPFKRPFESKNKNTELHEQFYEETVIIRDKANTIYRNSDYIKIRFPYSPLSLAAFKYASSSDDAKKDACACIMQHLKLWESEKGEKIVAFLKTRLNLPLNVEEFKELESKYYSNVTLELNENLVLDNYMEINNFHVRCFEANEIRLPYKINSLKISPNNQSMTIDFKEVSKAKINATKKLTLKGFYADLTTTDVIDIVDNDVVIKGITYEIVSSPLNDYEYLDIFNKSNFLEIKFMFKTNALVKFLGDNIKRETMRIYLPEASFDLQLKSQKLKTLALQEMSERSSIGEKLSIDVDAPLDEFRVDFMKANTVVVHQERWLPYFQRFEDVQYVEESPLKSI